MPRPDVWQCGTSRVVVAVVFCTQNRTVAILCAIDFCIKVATELFLEMSQILDRKIMLLKTIEPDMFPAINKTCSMHV